MPAQPCISQFLIDEIPNAARISKRYFLSAPQDTGHVPYLLGPASRI